MITRINFIEKRRFLVTYGVLLLGVGGSILCCGLLYGVLHFSSFRAQNRIQALQMDIERLKAERERIIHQETPLSGQGFFIQIQAALENAPAWSHLLDNLTQALPSRIWLGSIKSADKEGSPSKKEIILNGQAKNPQAITAFLANLEASPHFEKVVLTTASEEANGLFQFTIACDIGSKKWILKE